MNILGLPGVGKILMVRDVYKCLYNTVVWGKRPSEDSDIAQDSKDDKSYIIVGTPGK